MLRAFHIIEAKTAVAHPEEPAFGEEITGVGVAVPQFVIDDVAVLVDDYGIESDTAFHCVEDDLTIAPLIHVIDNKCWRRKDFDGFQFLGLCA